MGLPVQEQIKWWSAALLVLAFFIWMMGNTLLPFMAGAAIAYFLDPLADKLEAKGASRTVATTVVMLGAIAVLIVFLLALIPLFGQQIQALSQLLPGYAAKATEWAIEAIPAMSNESSAVRKAIALVETNLKEGVGAIARNLLTSSMAVFEFLMLIVVAPVVAFYLLLDWDRMIATIDGWLPREHAPVIRSIAGQVDDVMHGFLHGQMSVCLILGVFYAVGLELVGLDFGIVVGFIGGLLSFIPFVGAALGGILAVGLGAFQFLVSTSPEGLPITPEPGLLALIALIFVAGQVLEGYVLTPRLVGNSVGLHPVWLMFSLSAFGALFGFVGLLVAVPAAASIGVLLRFGLAQYQSGRLYRGPEAFEPTDAGDESG